MARRKVQFVRGAYYHVYNRGANRISIYHNDENYRFLIQKLKEYREKLEVTVVAYCLMPNHYHWLIRQDGDVPAGLLPRRVFNGYVKAFNSGNGRSGTLFEDRFKAIMVESDEYLHHLCRYIHANPVLHGIAADVELWPYSNYLDWVGKRRGTLVDQVFVQQHFPSVQSLRGIRAIVDHRQRVATYGFAGVSGRTGERVDR